jgi:hypothetical protein
MEEKKQDKKSKVDDVGKKAEKVFETGSDVYNKAEEVIGKGIMYIGKAAIKITTGAVKLGVKIGEKGLEETAKEEFGKLEQKAKDLGNKVKDKFKDEESAKKTIYQGVEKIVDASAATAKYVKKTIGKFSGVDYATFEDVSLKNKAYSIGDRYNGMLKKEQVEDCKKYVTNLKSKMTKTGVAKDVAQYIADEAYKNASASNEELTDSLKKWRMDEKNQDPTMTIKAVEVMAQYIKK